MKLMYLFDDVLYLFRQWMAVWFMLWIPNKYVQNEKIASALMNTKTKIIILNLNNTAEWCLAYK